MGTLWDKCISYLKSVWNYTTIEFFNLWDSAVSFCLGGWNDVCDSVMRGLEWCGSFWDALW